jgi:hypothetical protein
LVQFVFKESFKPINQTNMVMVGLVCAVYRDIYKKHNNITNLLHNKHKKNYFILLFTWYNMHIQKLHIHYKFF